MEEQKLKKPCKSKYKQPDVEVITFDYSDIITASICNGNCGSHTGCTGDVSVDSYC